MSIKAVIAFLAIALAIISHLCVPLWAHVALCAATLFPIIVAHRTMAKRPTLSNLLLQSWYVGYILLASLVGRLSILISIAVSGMFSDRPDAKLLTDFLGGGVTALFATAFFEPFNKMEGGLWPEPLFRKWFENANQDLNLQGSADEKTAFDAVNQLRVFNEEKGTTLVDGWGYSARAKRAEIVEIYRKHQSETPPEEKDAADAS
ncbi:hypothetical protein HY29_17470 [Hyphomonas beringensis]|uniref:Uncharacterized protein n=1 Tax=Hyphomonas beringensis TaxID=1280946 RepID=A0A062U9E7_9PROT|nr:hypothetical protein [Hyphomonas beringensis]KCZ53204.1 hypothetical protein HY29_17470 [Hyphomonas beringensis]